jgi:hypothetical protein
VGGGQVEPLQPLKRHATRQLAAAARRARAGHVGRRGGAAAWWRGGSGRCCSEVNAALSAPAAWFLGWVSGRRAGRAPPAAQTPRYSPASRCSAPSPPHMTTVTVTHHHQNLGHQSPLSSESAACMVLVLYGACIRDLRRLTLVVDSRGVGRHDVTRRAGHSEGHNHRDGHPTSSTTTTKTSDTKALCRQSLPPSWF